MDGDQKTTAPATGRHYNPADVPPSLTEPSQLPQPTAPVAIEHAAPTPAAAAPVIPSLPAPQAVASHQAGLPNAMSSPTATESAAPQAPAATDNSFYHPDAADNFGPQSDVLLDRRDSMRDQPVDQEVSWVSSGEALQSRAASWRLKMTLVAVVMGVVVYFVTKDVVSSGAVAFAGLLFGFLGARKPPALSYQMNSRGIMIGQRYYNYGQFRAFSVADETVSLVPLKRFSPLLSMHVDYQQREQILQLLSNHLPMEVHKRDAMDMIINKVKF